MTPSLPLILDDRSLPDAELRAAALDGDVRPLAAAYCSIDVHPSAQLRAEALAPSIPRGLIAERMTAAWLHGASSRFPMPLQLCVRSTSRIHTPKCAERSVRQVVLADSELARAGPLGVTTFFRTAIDLLRWEPEFDEQLALCIRTLLLAAGADGRECRARLRAVPHLAHKQRALRRLDELPGFGTQPALAGFARLNRR
ncbi:hypothetical protein [Herbiconiux sp.]|uniref:hypothetical protein n=1 Tax=Herbiconiux sp. TaxID=1871186 RepID=UPI0025BEEF38|nr:hypothetical protein [Herbiconiux sp.]